MAEISNAELVRRGFALWNDRLLEYFHEDAV